MMRYNVDGVASNNTVQDCANNGLLRQSAAVLDWCCQIRSQGSLVEILYSLYTYKSLGNIRIINFPKYKITLEKLNTAAEDKDKMRRKYND